MFVFPNEVVKAIDKNLTHFYGKVMIKKLWELRLVGRPFIMPAVFSVSF
jgi:hypothetical protein